MHLPDCSFDFYSIDSVFWDFWCRWQFYDCISIVYNLSFFHLTTFFLNLFLIFNYLFFHLSLLPQRLIFQFSFYRVFLFLGIMENLSNIKQKISKEIFLFPALEDEKYVFALWCLKIYFGVQCLFSFYCYSSLIGTRASRVYCLPSKRMEFPSSSAFTCLNLHVRFQAEGYIEV